MHPPRFIIPFAQEALAPVKRVLALNVETDWHLDMLGEEITIEQDNFVFYQGLKDRGLHVESRIEQGEFDRALVVLSKHAEHNKAMIGRAWRMVKEGGDILIEGAKTDGADSIIRGIKALGIEPNIEPKSHGKIAWFMREQGRVGAIAEWEKADNSFQNDDGYHVRKGVFSSNKIDKGTAYFLEELTLPIKGKVADFGGGYGVITKALLARNPDITSMDLYEVSALACDCAKANINDPRASFHWSDVALAPKQIYDVIVSNPPFHQGREGDPEIGRSFITAAAKALRARGDFYMVANKHLPYEHQLRASFGQVEIIAETNTFKIFKAGRPSS